MRFFPSALVICVFLGWGPRTLMAQPQAMPRELLLFKEVPTVVSATGREQPLTQSPSAITVITAEEIRQSGATSLPELLRGVPGLDFFRTSASSVSIAARGLNLEDRARIQVLVDGLSVYEDVSAVLFWHQIPIPLEEIERIEIVRSPATALYGDKAFAGVVHILTRSPEALQGTQVSGTLGEGGTGIVNLIHAGVAGHLSYKASFGYDRTQQFPNPAVGRAHGELGRADTRGHFQVNYTLPQGSQVSLAGGIDDFDRREVLPAGPFQAVVAGGLGFLKASYAVGDFKATLSYNRFDVDIRSESFFEDIVASVDVYQVRLQHSLALGRTNVLTGGTTYRGVAADSPGLIGGSRAQHLPAFFLQDEWTLHEHLALTVGVGVDVHPEAGVSASPRGSLVYSPWKEHTFRVSVAKAFRSPSYLENFEALPFKLLPSPPPPLPQTSITLGNRDLQPEEMLSYEVGYQTLLLNRLRVRIDLFYNQLEQLIVLGQPVFSQVSPLLPPIPLGLQFINRGEGEIFGGEIGVDVFITSWLKGSLNYSYQERKGDVSAMADVAPHHKANAGLTFSFINGLSANVLVHYGGEAEAFFGRFLVPSLIHVAPYTIVNLRLAYRFTVFGNQTEAAIQVFNLLNDVHREVPGGDLLERRVSGTLRFRF